MTANARTFGVCPETICTALSDGVPTTSTDMTATGKLVAENGAGASLWNSGHRNRATAKRFINTAEGFVPACGQCAGPTTIYAYVWEQNVSGSYRTTVGSTGGSGGGGGGQSSTYWQFEYPDGSPAFVDFVWRLGSFMHNSGAQELAFVGTVWDDFYPGANSIIGRSNNVPSGTTYADNNNGGSLAFHRHVSQLWIRIQGNNGLVLFFGGQVVYSRDHYEETECQDCAIPGGLGDPNLCVSTRFCAEPPDFPDVFSGAQEISTDFGATWAPYTGSYTPPAATVAGEVRIRRQYTIPTGYRGHYVHEVDGVTYGGNGVVGAGLLFWDNVQQSNPFTGRTDTEYSNIKHFNQYTAVVAGAHTIEWRGGVMVAGTTYTPVLSTDTRKVLKVYDKVNSVSCSGGAPKLFNATGAAYTLPAGYTLNEGVCGRNL